MRFIKYKPSSQRAYFKWLDFFISAIIFEKNYI